MFFEIKEYNHGSYKNRKKVAQTKNTRKTASTNVGKEQFSSNAEVSIQRGVWRYIRRSIVSLMKLRTLSAYLVLTLTIVACNSGGNKEFTTLINKNILSECNENLRLAMMRDKFTPPVAARNYAYANIAAYQSLLAFNSGYKSLANQLNDMPETPGADTSTMNADLVAFTAFTKVATVLTYSEFIVKDFIHLKDSLYTAWLPESNYQASKKYGEQIADIIIEWASRDTFSESRNFDQFQPANTVGYWEQTPPDYSRAIEPNWNRIRPFVIPSADAFKPKRPTAYDSTPGSPFMLEAMEVYQAVNDSTPERIAIARFWDDNPNVSHHVGHMMYSTEKPSPAGHWMGITSTAIRMTDASLAKQAEAFTSIAIGMHDAFIACWDEKYRSNYIRPETVINRRIDADWRPILQTPAFPEYPSGHSVVSGTLTTLLTYQFGDNFAYTDSTELPFGNQPRQFESFKMAATEACISRQYGGIHFTPAIVEGRTMGDSIGEYINKTISLK
ncbi:vanadium-dependent haloperoxidase [Bacteroidia bacterium]|nr:vanadium-dependent haloperoxidase [Bacteroidia bacterium]